MANEMLASARSGQPISAAGLLRLSVLEAHGSSVQAPYFLKEIGSIVGTELDIDLQRGESGLVSPSDYDCAVGTLWKWQGIANS